MQRQTQVPSQVVGFASATAQNAPQNRGLPHTANFAPGSLQLGGHGNPPQLCSSGVQQQQRNERREYERVTFPQTQCTTQPSSSSLALPQTQHQHQHHQQQVMLCPSSSLSRPTSTQQPQSHYNSPPLASGGFGSRGANNPPPQPDSFENCFFMGETRLLLQIDGASHEVDSIVECRGPQKGREQQFKLEMCCPCCQGRRIQLNSTKLMEIANEPLINQAQQTIEMHSEGLDISDSSRVVPNATTSRESMIKDDEDFDMIDDDIDLITANGTLTWKQQQQVVVGPTTTSLHYLNDQFCFKDGGSGKSEVQQFCQPQSSSSLLSIGGFYPSQFETSSFPTTLSMSNNPDFIDTTTPATQNMLSQQSQQQMLHVQQSQMPNQHQLKDDNDKTNSYDEEEFNMNEQSEEGTADDYDSMAENPQFLAPELASQDDGPTSGVPVLGNQLSSVRQRAEKPSLDHHNLQSSCRPSLQEFTSEADEEIVSSGGGKRRRIDPFQQLPCGEFPAGKIKTAAAFEPMLMHQQQLARNFSTNMDFLSPMQQSLYDDCQQQNSSTSQRAMKRTTGTSAGAAHFSNNMGGATFSSGIYNNPECSFQSSSFGGSFQKR